MKGGTGQIRKGKSFAGTKGRYYLMSDAEASELTQETRTPTKGNISETFKESLRPGI